MNGFTNKINIHGLLCMLNQRMIKIYYCNPAICRNSGIEPVLAVLDMEAISFHTYHDPVMVLKLTKGRSSPSCGFVCQVDDGVVIISIYELCEWITKNGLRRC